LRVAPLEVVVGKTVNVFKVAAKRVISTRNEEKSSQFNSQLGGNLEDLSLRSK